MNTSWKKKNPRTLTSYALPARKKPECASTFHFPRWNADASGVRPTVAELSAAPNINA
jgi:hypothetical protein